MKTYSRQSRVQSGPQEPPAKRRRITTPVEDYRARGETTYAIASDISADSLALSSATVPSSPPHRSSSTQPSSDNAEPTSTPPSSPPQPTIQPPRKNAFALMRPTPTASKVPKPKARTRLALSESSGNARAASKPAGKEKPRPPLTQLHLDLGQSVSRRCETCGMSYTLTSAEDVALHDRFHAQNVGGVDLGKSFIEAAWLRPNIVWTGTGGNVVVECGRKDGKALKRNVRCVLDLVTQELGAVGISDEALWSSVERTPSTGLTKTVAERADRFKAFLYVRRSKCVAFCLAEQIQTAARVVGSLSGKGSESSYSVAGAKDPAVMGISRIWTSKEHRGKGLATLLLNCAQENFLYGVDVRDEEVAFSQPTESGTLLARNWFGSDAGWHVYDDT